MEKTSSAVTVALGEDDFPSDEVLQNPVHCISVDVSSSHSYVNLTFSTRKAFYDFARSLLREAIFENSGQMELYPLLVGETPEVVNGSRLTENSSRIFIFYPKSADIPIAIK